MPLMAGHSTLLRWKDQLEDTLFNIITNKLDPLDQRLLRP
jgi:hypothetical protein